MESSPSPTSYGRWLPVSCSSRPAARAVCHWLVLFSCWVPSHAAGQDTVGATIDGILSAARAPWARWPDFTRYVDDVNRLYFRNPRETLWLDGTHLRPQVDPAIAALREAVEHGLDPGDYDADLLAQVASEAVRTPLSAVNRGRFDVLLSLSLIRFLDDLRSGRLHRRWLPPSGLVTDQLDLAAAITQAIAGDSLSGLIAALTPHLAQYRNLQRLLSRYRHLAEDTMLRPLTETLPVHAGDTYVQAADLRRLLTVLGDLPSDPEAPAGVYAVSDARGVRRFQVRHGLQPSGILDSLTFAQLRTPLAHRVRQIELALERLRWFPPLGQQPFLVVNIPAFQLFAFDSVGGTGTPALGMRVIVGQALDKQTPVMFEQMRSVEFRPAWNVPRSILLEEIIPLLERDLGYLARNHMELVAAHDQVIGTGVTPELLGQLKRGELRVRQRAGADNPLGSTKFVFPNAANVYLHGTPRAELFAQTRRDFSHGCIRVEDPTGLAAWVLRDQPRWTRARILAAQNSSVTTRTLLTRSMPVVIFYTTAVASPSGQAWFFPDIYGHDRTLEEALRAGPTSP